MKGLVLAIVALLAACNGNDSYHLFIRFENTYGLDVDDELTANGLEIGRVSSLEHRRDTGWHVLVGVAISREHQVPVGSEFTLGVDVLGTVLFEVDFADSVSEFYADGATVTGVNVGISQETISKRIDSLLQDSTFRPILIEGENVIEQLLRFFQVTDSVIKANQDSTIEHSEAVTFSELSYERAVAYEYDGTGGFLILDRGGELHQSVTSSKPLSSDQAADLVNLIDDPKMYGANYADCFDPHLGVVFYRLGRVVGHVSICLDCNYLLGSQPIPASMQQSVQVSPDYSRPLIGFSKAARAQIRTLCQQLGFSECVKRTGSTWD